jgi:hypothetical protein
VSLDVGEINDSIADHGEETVEQTPMLVRSHLCVTSFAHVNGRSAQKVKGEASFIPMSLAYGPAIALKKSPIEEYASAVKFLL